jgi:SAM-dependent methyltransferase
MAFYDETMAPDYARWRTVHPQLLDALIAYSGARANSRVLELGCGPSAISERTGCAGWGLDPSTAMLAQSTNRHFSPPSLGLRGGRPHWFGRCAV